MDLKDTQIKVYDSKGQEKIMEILFTYHSEERNRDYVFFFDPNNPDEVIMMRYEKSEGNDQGELFDIEDEEEIEELEDVFKSYNEGDDEDK